jgi:hypothetical protein
MMRIFDRLADTPAQVMSHLGETLKQTRLAVALMGDESVYPVMGPYCAPKRVQHPQLGLLELHCQTLVDPDQSQTLLVFTAVPGSESYEKLQLLPAFSGQGA